MATSAAASSLLRLIVRENCTLLPRALPVSLPVPFTDALLMRCDAGASAARVQP